MTHAQLIKRGEAWLRSRRCRIVLSEQTVDCGEVPDIIGWRSDGHSVVIECKVSRADFFADQKKTSRASAGDGMGSERFYLAPKGLIGGRDLPAGWGLLECHRGHIEVAVAPAVRNARKQRGFLAEMKLLVASLRRVEVRIEPQTITEFLKWKNRMADYNGGKLPEGILSSEEEAAQVF